MKTNYPGKVQSIVTMGSFVRVITALLFETAQLAGYHNLKQRHFRIKNGNLIRYAISTVFMAVQRKSP
jgi:hypothetical protein